MPAQNANQEVERIAALLVADLGARGLLLDYSPESLGKLDQLLANDGHEKGNGDRNLGLVELAGAYLGEVLRRGLGGDWRESAPPDNGTGLLMDSKSECWVWRHAIIYKQLEQGNKCLKEIYPQIVSDVAKFRRGRGAN